MRGDRRIVVREELAAVVDEAERSLLADSEAGVYVRAGLLVRVVAEPGVERGGLKRPVGTPVIQVIPLDALRERLDLAARWVKHDARTRAERAVLPPKWVAPTLAARGTWAFPHLEGVVEAPTLTPNGEVLDTAGYDPRTGLLLIPAGRFPEVPSNPSGEDVRDSVALLRQPLLEFPFIAESDRAAVIAAIFSLVARHAVPGCVPMFAIRSPAPGTGKGLLADAIAFVGTGRTPARNTLPPDETELRKVILAVAMEGSSCVLLDNVDRALGSATLAAALTATTWQDRLLGVNARPQAPLRALWLVTGNNVVFRGDLGRRVVPIDLDARVEHPEDRAFRHADLLGWVREHRAALVSAALTVLRAYHVAGRRAHGCGPRKGSFEAWDDLIRGACAWAGFGDPLGGVERIRREDDGDVAALRSALGAWRNAFGADGKTVAEAVSVSLARAESDFGSDPTLRDALLGLVTRDKLEARALAYALRKVKGRIVGGLWFEVAGEQRSGMRWRVGTSDRGGGDAEIAEMLSHYAGADSRVENREYGTISAVSASPHTPPPDGDGTEATDPLDAADTPPQPAADGRCAARATPGSGLVAGGRRP